MGICLCTFADAKDNNAKKNLSKCKKSSKMFEIDNPKIDLNKNEKIRKLKFSSVLERTPMNSTYR